MINKVIEGGRLTRDPEVRFTQSGKTVCNFTLAVDRFTTNAEGQREADFIPIVVWGKVAELCGDNLTKGQRALVEGRLQIRSYEAKDGSGKRWQAEVVAESVQFLDRKAKTNQPETADGNMESFGKEVPDEEVPAF